MIFVLSDVTSIIDIITSICAISSCLLAYGSIKNSSRESKLARSPLIDLQVNTMGYFYNVSNIGGGIAYDIAFKVLENTTQIPISELPIFFKKGISRISAGQKKGYFLILKQERNGAIDPKNRKGKLRVQISFSFEGVRAQQPIITIDFDEHKHEAMTPLTVEEVLHANLPKITAGIDKIERGLKRKENPYEIGTGKDSLVVEGRTMARFIAGDKAKASCTPCKIRRLN